MQRFCQGSGLVGLAPTGRDGGEGPFCWPPPFAEPRNKTQPTHTRNRDYEYGANKSGPNTVPAHPDTSSSSTSTSLYLNCITQSGIDTRIPAVNAIVISALSATTCGGTEIQSPLLQPLNYVTGAALTRTRDYTSSCYVSPFFSSLPSFRCSLLHISY